MTSSFPPKRVPEIVRIVLCELGRLHAAREIAPPDYQAQLERLVREELTPRNLCLLTRELQDGTIRYIVKDGVKGVVCDLLDWQASEAGADLLEGDDSVMRRLSGNGGAADGACSYH